MLAAIMNFSKGNLPYQTYRNLDSVLINRKGIKFVFEGGKFEIVFGFEETTEILIKEKLAVTSKKIVT